MRQLRCGHGDERPDGGAASRCGCEAVKVADRRHVHAWVPTAAVPDRCTDRLAGVAVPVTVDGVVVGWWFDVAAALAAGDTAAAAEFARWSSTFTHRRLLGEASTIAAVVRQLEAASAGALARFLTDGFCALGGAELDAFIATEYDAEVAASNVVGDAVELFDDRGPVAARVWPATEPLVLTDEGGVTVTVDDGLWLAVGDTRRRVEGWRIDGGTGDVIVSSGGADDRLDAAAGTVLTRQAAGSVRVEVRRRPFAEVCSDVAGELYDAADTAARTGRYLLIGIEPERAGAGS